MVSQWAAHREKKKKKTAVLPGRTRFHVLPACGTLVYKATLYYVCHGGYVFTYGSLFVGCFFFQQDYTKITERVPIKLGWRMCTE